MARSCVFCGGDGALTREHVLPTWIHDVLEIAGPMKHFVGQQQKREAKKLDVTLRAVCSSCNTGWLSTLEGRTRSVLGPAMKGAPVSLSPADQALAAAWAVKTSLLLELAQRHERGRGFAPASHFQYLNDHHSAPPDSMVWVGGVDAQGKDIAFSRAVVVAGDHDVEAGYLAVVAVGYLVLVAFGWAADMPELGPVPTPTVPAHLQPALLQIWPSGPSPIAVPPNVVFANHRHLNILFNPVHDRTP